MFRALLREMIRDNRLPDYVVSEVLRDIPRVTPRSTVIEPGEGPRLNAETLDETCILLHRADVYALQAEWRTWWTSSGRPRLRNAGRALLDRVRMGSSRD